MLAISIFWPIVYEIIKLEQVAYILLHYIWESLNKCHLLLFMKYMYTYNTHSLPLQLFSFVSSELCKLYYYKTHATPTYIVIIHLESLVRHCVLSVMKYRYTYLLRQSSISSFKALISCSFFSAVTFRPRTTFSKFDTFFWLSCIFSCAVFNLKE